MAVNRIAIGLVGAALVAAPQAAAAQEPRVAAGPQGVTIDLVDAELRVAVQALARYLDRPVMAAGVAGNRVTLQTPQPVPATRVPALLRGLLEGQGYEMVEQEGSYVVRAKQRSPAAESPMSPRAWSPPPGASGGTADLVVIRLRHARASDVSATINALYGRGSALGELGARPRTLGDQLEANRASAAASQLLPSSQMADVGQAPRGGFGGEVTIVPDSRTNSLLVRASRGDFELVQAAVRELDVRPLQVMIEVMIAEVRRNSDFSYALSASLGQTALPGAGNTTLGGETRGDASPDLMVRALGVGGVDLGLVLRAGVSRGVVTILSRPLLFAANNEQAEIVVGDQRPFVQLQRTTDGGSQDQVIQYKDVGTRLAVRPTISGDGYVQLQVTQEVNNATAERGPQNAPIISTRTIETALLVRDGRTAVLGGLAEALRERGSSGVPFLSSIPVVGGIFGGKSRASRDAELFVFLTPRIVRSDAELDSVTADVRRNGGRAGKMSRKAPPLVLPRASGKGADAPAARPATPPATPATRSAPSAAAPARVPPPSPPARGPDDRR